jgi:hypothetical protein
MESGGFQHHPLMRLTISLTLVLLFGFWVTNLVLYTSKMGLSPASVVTYYNGSEEAFLPPRTMGSMVEVTHAHLAMMALLLLLLTHLVIFSPFRKGVKLLFIWGTFGAAVASEAGGWLVRFVSPALAPVKVAGFVVLESLLGILLFAVAWSLWSGSSVHRQNGRAITKDILVPGESEEGDEVVSVGGNLRGRSGRS